MSERCPGSYMKAPPTWEVRLIDGLPRSVRIEAYCPECGCKIARPRANGTIKSHNRKASREQSA